MKNRITAFLLIILAICTLFSVTALAADDISIDLSTIEKYRGMKGEMKNGVLELDVIGYQETKESPSIFLPAMEIDADSYGTLELVMKSHTVTDKAKIHKFYFRTTELGYAEADPTADVEGLDAGRKMAIMGSIAFHSRITFADVYTEGITKISSQDMNYAKDMGCVIKLLGIARNT